jgi:AraC-like DNA-binding protein
LLFALEPTLGHFTADGAAGAFAAEPTPLDSSQFVFVAAGTTVQVALTSPVSRTLVLEIHPPLVARCAESYVGEIDPTALDRMLTSSRVLPRTTWVHELAQRYLFERAVCRKRDNDATRFLETELLKELYFVAREQDASHTRTSFLAGRSPTLRRALAYLEARIFDEVDPIELAKHAGASPSSLRRAFRRELGTSPLAYVRARRLDEARVRLAHGRTSVSEVALAVGYRSIAAFSRAFHARFGVPPSSRS